MANDWNRNKHTVNVNYDNGYSRYNINAEDVAESLKSIGFNPMPDIEGDPWNTYRLEIYSSNGVKITAGSFNTVLNATLYKNNINITSELEDSHFKWIRVSMDNDSDIIWNQKHSYGTKKIEITNEDINKRAVFHCAYLTGAIATKFENNVYTVYNQLINKLNNK